MKLVTNNDAFVVVSLSRRNIEGLLAQADANEGTSELPQLMKRSGERMLIVTLQDDADHYEGGRAGSSGPGQVYGEVVPV